MNKNVQQNIQRSHTHTHTHGRKTVCWKNNDQQEKEIRARRPTACNYTFVTSKWKIVKIANEYSTATTALIPQAKAFAIVPSLICVFCLKCGRNTHISFRFAFFSSLFSSLFRINSKSLTICTFTTFLSKMKWNFSLTFCTWFTLEYTKSHIWFFFSSVGKFDCYAYLSNDFVNLFLPSEICTFQFCISYFVCIQSIFTVFFFLFLFFVHKSLTIFVRWSEFFRYSTGL